MLSCVPHKIILLLHSPPFARDEDTYSLPSVLNRNSFWRWQAKYWDLGFLLLVSLLLFCSVWSLQEPGIPLSSVKGECPCLRGGERRASEVPLLFREGA